MPLKNNILKHLIGNDALDEKAKLESWKDEAHANIEGLKSLNDSGNDLQMLKDYQDVNQDQAWQRVENNMPSRKIMTFKTMRNIAAVFVLVLGAVWGISTLNKTQVNNIEPLMTYQSEGYLKIDYKDGSKIDLDDQSNLQEVGYRQFELSGRAYFSVAKDTEHSFKIHTKHGDIEVLGTEFNVLTSSSETQVLVRSGKVKIAYEGSEYILHTDDYIVCSNGQAVVSKHPKVNPDIWRDQEIKFVNQSIHQVMETLATYYNVRLEWNTSMQSEDACRINTVFQKQRLEDILKEMKILADLQYEIKPGKISIHGFKC